MAPRKIWPYWDLLRKLSAAHGFSGLTSPSPSPATDMDDMAGPAVMVRPRGLRPSRIQAAARRRERRRARSGHPRLFFRLASAPPTWHSRETALYISGSSASAASNAHLPIMLHDRDGGQRKYRRTMAVFRCTPWCVTYEFPLNQFRYSVRNMFAGVDRRPGQRSVSLRIARRWVQRHGGQPGNVDEFLAAQLTATGGESQ